MRRNETVSGDGGKKRKQDEFIAALLTHSSVEAAAIAAGISRATGWRWLQRQDVLDRLRQARPQAWSRAMAQLQEAGPEAVEALRKILRDAEGEAPRVSAARTILELGVRAVELESIEERIGKLEQIDRGGKGQAMTEKIKRQLDRLEESMVPPKDAPPFDIEIVFVEPVEGCPGGRIRRAVRLSELTAGKGGRQ